MQQSWRERLTRAVIAGALVIAAMLALSSRPALADVQYFYDEAGRLIQVVDAAGESAQYVYDAAGNIVQIVRVSAGTVSVAGFTPKSGPSGTAVTIYGAGFSPTPANNTVKFNGTTASVTSAAVNQLVATVPGAATSGTIAVAVGAQTATSAESFTVTSGGAGPPSITGFTPGGGPPGTAVTITGTNFDPVLINNTVRFNTGQAFVTSTSTTQIVANVPSFAGSGPITVRTLYGTAQSADDFIIPPAGYAYADIISRARIAVDGASGSLAIGAANKHGMVLFDGAPGDYLSLQLSSVTVSPAGNVAYKVFDPTNAQIAAGNVSSTAKSIHLPRLGRSGTYSMIFSPGAATASLSFALVRNQVISAAQPTLNASVAVAGQSIRGIHAGAATSAMTMRLSVSSTTPANQTVNLTVYKPDGSQLVTTGGSPSTDGGAVYSPSLPISGDYAVLVVPPNTSTGTMSVTLNPGMDVAIDGPSIGMSTTTAGYARRVLFSGTAGQLISVAMTGFSYSPASGFNSGLRLYNPDGSQLAITTNCYTVSLNCAELIATLPVSGTYSVTMTPPSAVTFSGTLTISNVIAGTLISGTPFNLDLARPGNFARLSFGGTAGQPATVRLGIGAMTPNPNVVMWVLRSNGAVLTSGTSTQSADGMVLHVPSLPATETYVVQIVAWVNSTGTMSVTLNPAMDAVTDGAPVGVSSAVAGHTKRFLFAGTAGQRVSVALTGVAYSPASSGTASVIVSKPDGTHIASTNNCYTSNPGAACAAFAAVLPVSGPYTIAITPPAAVTFSGTLTLSNVIDGTLVSGTPFSLNLTRAGHHGRLSFSGTAGQAVTLRLAMGETTPANQTSSMSLYRSNGTLVGSHKTGSPSTDGMVDHVASLPATDTYSVYITPWFNGTGAMTMTLDPAMDLTVDAASSTIATTTAGYTKRFLFAATAGQRVGIGTTSHVHTPASGASTSLVLYGPSGSTVSSMNCTTSGLARCELNMWGNSAGPFTIVVTPPAGVNFSGTVTLSNYVTGALTIGGGAVAVALSRDGQDGWYTFSGTSGQLLRLSVTTMATTPAGQIVTFNIIRPNGSSLAYTTPSGATTNFDIPALDATGTHTIWISPWWGATATMNIAVNPR